MSKPSAIVLTSCSVVWFDRCDKLCNVSLIMCAFCAPIFTQLVNFVYRMKRYFCVFYTKFVRIQLALNIQVASWLVQDNDIKHSCTLAEAALAEYNIKWVNLYYIIVKVIFYEIAIPIFSVISNRLGKKKGSYFACIHSIQSC